MSFTRMVQSLNYVGEKTERIEDPRDDSNQQAWVNVISYLRNKGEAIPNATTTEELERRYQGVAGLLVVRSRQVALDAARKRTNQKTYSAQEVEELDETLEDTQSDAGFRLIEAREELRTLYNNSSPYVQAALRRFAYAFTLLERGEKIPGSLKTAIARDRSRTGLPLDLRR